MPFSHLPPLLTSTFSCLSSWLHKRSALRLPQLLLGVLFATGRRTVTSWFRAAAITDDFRPAYTTVCAVGRHVPHMAVSTFLAVKPLLSGPRLTVAIDDTPTPRYGPEVQGAGIHHNPSPGPAGEKYVFGHLWVTLAGLAKHPAGAWPCPCRHSSTFARSTCRNSPANPPALPHQAGDGGRATAVAAALAANDQVESGWWSMALTPSGRFCVPPAGNVTVFGRLRKDAALWSVPVPVPPEQRGPAARPTASSGSAWPSVPGRSVAGSGGMCAVRRGDQDDQDVSGDLASSRGSHPRSAGERKRLVAFFCTNSGGAE